MDTLRRSAQVRRETLETKISVSLDLDGGGDAQLTTGVGFFDHMLDQIARHAMIDLQVEAQGDLHIDAHHTVEDVGIAIGQALAQALGDKKGLTRFGCAHVPLDEALTRVVVDLSGRPGLVLAAQFSRDRIGDFDVELVREFFQALVNHAAITVHIDVLRGDNAHHQVETIFKAFARALRAAATPDAARGAAAASTKGSL